MALPELNKLKEKASNQSAENFIMSDTALDIMTDDLSRLTLNDLATRYIAINMQSQLLQGRILLEARRRLADDGAFGKWIVSNNLDVGTQQHRNRLVHLATFFENRDLDGISITAAYELSAPRNEKIAEKVYEEIRGKSLSVEEVKRRLNADIESKAKAVRDAGNSYKESKPSKKVIVSEYEDDEIIDLSDDSDDFEIYTPPMKSEKRTLIEIGDSIEETILYVLLGEMTKEQKMIVLENCKYLLESN